MGKIRKEVRLFVRCSEEDVWYFIKHKDKRILLEAGHSGTLDNNTLKMRG
jgi:hypothetical protein